MYTEDLQAAYAGSDSGDQMEIVAIALIIIFLVGNRKPKSKPKSKSWFDDLFK